MDFDLTSYSRLREELSRDGIRCGVNGRHQVTVSRHDSAIWPGRGNSFWVTRATGEWRLFTWTSRGYAPPDGADFAELCRRCMGIGAEAMSHVPAEIVAEFRLRELSDDETEPIFHAMKVAP